jgi:CheY-like chemotaxis protein
VNARSKGKGRGSTFTVTLPVNATSTAETNRQIDEKRALPLIEPDEKPWRAEISGIRILIVDDEADALSLMRRLLEDGRAKVYTANSANEGLLVIEKERPDILISDIGMPGLDGYDLVKELRRKPVDKGGATPAIAVTAYARSEDRTRAILAGFQHHVTKPVSPAELLAIISSLYSTTKSHSQ